MAYFQGKRVSKQWKVVLEAAWRDGVRFQLNSGRRLLSEQRALFNQNMIRIGVPKPGHAFTAWPSPIAPHIRAGRPDHALDVDSYAYGNGEQRLQNWLISKGARAVNTVSGESWHLEVPLADLLKLYRRYRDPMAGFWKDERDWIAEYDRLRKAKKNPKRRKQLQGMMAERRKKIFRTANKNGWHRGARLKRFAALRLRTLGRLK
jgi:phage gp16-like protein